jgi:hypothetical protein
MPGITKKKEYNTQNTVKVLNLEKFLFAVLLVCKGYTFFDNIVQTLIQMSSCAASLK